MIYFCIPSHNEATTVGLVLWKINRVLEGSTREFQLLVGDDASTDATSEVLAPYAKALPLTVLRSDTQLGYAATLERLLREALKRSDRHKRDAVVILPADFAVDPADVPELLKRLDSGADLVVGESTLSDAPTAWHRRVRKWAPRLLGKRVRVDGVRDIVSGCIALRLIVARNAYRDRVGPWFPVEGWAANAQLITWSAAAARRVDTVAITERMERHQRASRHSPWPRAKELWAARKHLEAPPPGLATAKQARGGDKDSNEEAA